MSGVVAAPAGSPVGREYRLPRSILWLGLFFCGVFIAAGILSVRSALANHDGSLKNPEEAAVLLALGCGILTLPGLYLVRAYFVERLLPWDDRVVVIGSFRTRAIRFAEVTRVKWCLSSIPPGGSLALYVGKKKAVIFFGTYGPIHGQALWDFFHAAVSQEVPAEWPGPTPERMEKIQRILVRIFAGLAVLGVATVAVGIWNPTNDTALRWNCIAIGGVLAVNCGYPFVRYWRDITRNPPT